MVKSVMLYHNGPFSNFLYLQAEPPTNSNVILADRDEKVRYNNL